MFWFDVRTDRPTFYVCFGLSINFASTNPAKLNGQGESATFCQSQLSDCCKKIIILFFKHADATPWCIGEGGIRERDGVRKKNSTKSNNEKRGQDPWHVPSRTMVSRSLLARVVITSKFIFRWIGAKHSLNLPVVGEWDFFSHSSRYTSLIGLLFQEKHKSNHRIFLCVTSRVLTLPPVGLALQKSTRPTYIKKGCIQNFKQQQIADTRGKENKTVVFVNLKLEMFVLIFVSFRLILLMR